MNRTPLISTPRLETYKKYTSDPMKAIELHNMTMQVGSSLMAVIALIELGLRNKVHDQIFRDFGVEDWMLNPPEKIRFCQTEKRLITIAKKHARKAMYSKLSHKDKKALDERIYPIGVPAGIKHEILSRKRQETFEVNQGQIIAQTTILFWKRLFSKDYEEMLWRPSLRNIFPLKHIRRSDVS